MAAAPAEVPAGLAIVGITVDARPGPARGRAGPGRRP